MNKNDIDTYLSAVSKMKAQTYSSATCLLVATACLIAILSGYDKSYIVAGMWVSSGYLAMYVSEYFFGYPANKKQLLQIIKQQIDNDPDAIRYLSEAKLKTKK